MTHVLVARQDNAGDVLLAGPAVRAVAAGAQRVTLLCGPAGAEAARLLPGVDEVVVQGAEWIAADPQPVRREDVERRIDELAALRADRALVLTSFHQSPLPLALLLRMAGVAVIGAISEDYPGTLLDVRHHVPDDLHEARRGLSLARAMGFALPAGDDDRLRVRRPGGYPPATGHVVVHPGASVPARAWAPDGHAALVRALARRGRRVIVTGAPSERTLTRHVAGTDALDLGGRTSLGELADLLAGAACIVVGNTGPAHLAAAVGTPVVSLFSPVVPSEWWRPYGVPTVQLGNQLAGCRDSRARDCPLPGHPCLSEVSTDDVIAAVDRLTARAVAGVSG